MAECVVELCRQPALPAPVLVELGDLRLELALCVVHGDEVGASVESLMALAREEFVF